MIEILKKMFETNQGKSTIVIVGVCSICGKKTNIKITPTAGGFGLQGGVLFKCKPHSYLSKCPDCHEANRK